MEIDYYSNEIEINKYDIKKHGKFFKKTLLGKTLIRTNSKINFLSIIK